MQVKMEQLQALKNRELDGIAARLEDLGMTIDTLKEDLAGLAAEVTGNIFSYREGPLQRPGEN